MHSIEWACKFSPFPTVNLEAITAPRSGIFYSTTKRCSRNYSNSSSCKMHYEGLLQDKIASGNLVQCPDGFSSYIIKTKTCKIALTGIIPFPRCGGETEKLRAKEYPNNKVSVEILRRYSASLLTLQTHISGVERDTMLDVGSETIKKNANALHEIRKLNRTVKQTAERLCRKENPFDPDYASPELVQIWKTSELMSHQFDIVEILADEKLTSLPVKNYCELYPLVDKCVRIFRTVAVQRRLILRPLVGSHPKILVCDKTFPIIPTVLIENALKFSLSDTEIIVELKIFNGKCQLIITNTSTYNPIMDNKIFEKGYRASSEKEGSGYGLYLAQLVARQHRTEIKFSLDKIGDKMLCHFMVEFVTVK